MQQINFQIQYKTTKQKPYQTSDGWRRWIVQETVFWMR